MTAAGGPATGLTSTDIGVSETNTTAAGLSLQLKGEGAVYGDFTWAAASGSSFGGPNAGQTFGGGGGPVDPPPAGPCAVAPAVTKISAVQGGGDSMGTVAVAVAAAVAPGAAVASPT